MKTYIESQRFSNVVLVLIACLAAYVCSSAIWQIGFGHKIGNHPAPDFVLVLIAFFIIALAFIFFTARLKTNIDHQGFKYNFTGLFGGGSSTEWSDICKLEFMKSPYLGEGTRDWTKKNATAYVTRGGDNMGIMIYRKNGGRNIFISTKQIGELREFIKNNAPKGVEIVED